MADTTKDKIADTLERLLEHQSFDKITIKLLVTECGISRQSFYYYFKDILDVIEWLAHQNTQEFLRKSMEAGSYEEGILIFINFAFKNHCFIMRLLDSKHRGFIERVIVSSLRSFLEDALRQKKELISINYRDMDAILNFCAYGLTGLLLESAGEKQTDKKLLARQMRDLLLKVLT